MDIPATPKNMYSSLYIYISKVKWGNSKGSPFSIATTPSLYGKMLLPFPWIAFTFTLDMYLILLSAKQGRL